MAARQILSEAKFISHKLYYIRAIKSIVFQIFFRPLQDFLNIPAFIAFFRKNEAFFAFSATRAFIFRYFLIMRVFLEKAG